MTNDPSDHVRPQEKTLVVKPVLKSAHKHRDADAMLLESIGLADAINLTIVESGVINIAKATPATLFGKGQAETIGALIAEKEIKLAIVDYVLTPVQQRNLELAWKCKVIDRTGIILEIFGDRARTKEGQLQVELAALDYQKSRLVKSWTHLERQRGGFGFLGGPGESQLELDRRIIGDKIIRLKAELAQVRRTRGLQRKARERAEHPTIALIGYTNAGKSSLFNRLTGAEVLAKNMLFATLDPTMRGMQLPSGRNVILSDTVGFISELPTHLVEAFRATLEEVQLADIILHVRDIGHPETRTQREAVIEVLADLGVSSEDDRLIEVMNKIDTLPGDKRTNLQNYASRTTWEAHHAPRAGDLHVTSAGGSVGISALTGEGIPNLLKMLDDHLSATRKIYDIDLALGDGAALSWLYAHGKIVDKRDTKTKCRLKVELDAADYGRYQSRFVKGNHAKD